MKILTRFAVASALLVSVSAHAIDDQGVCKSNPAAGFKVLKDMGVIAFDTQTLHTVVSEMTRFDVAQLDNLLVTEGQINMKPGLEKAEATRSKMVGAVLASIADVEKSVVQKKDIGSKTLISTGFFMALRSGLNAYSKILDAVVVVKSNPQVSADAKAQAVQTARNSLLQHKLTAAALAVKVDELQKENKGGWSSEKTTKLLQNVLGSLETKTCQNSFRAL